MIGHVSRLCLVLTAALLLGTGLALSPQIALSQIHVDRDATGLANGDSWENAYSSLQNGLSEASSGTEIWVAEGTYRPDQGDNVTLGSREERFELKNNVGVYGGFVGQETAREDRDPEVHETVLSGNINAQDDSTDNSTQVVASVSDNRTTVLDGVTITNAGGGSGAYIFDSDPTFRNVTFAENSGEGSGGGTTIVAASDPIFERCIFVENVVAQGGGGAAYIESSSSAVFVRSTFESNTATFAGAVNLSGSISGDPDPPELVILNSKFMSNSVTNDEGAAISSNSSSMLIYGTTFFKNSGGEAVSDIGSDITLVNSTVVKNKIGIGVFSEDSEVDIRNSIFWKNGSDINTFFGPDVSVKNTVVEEGFSGESVFDADPQFVNLSEGDLRLTDGSPAVDAGNDEFLPEDIQDLDGDGDTSEPISVDLAGNQRIQGESVDLGPFEFEGEVDPVVPNVIFVDADASGAGDGSSWSDAYTSLQDALSAVSTGVDIWVAEGTYKPDQGDNVTLGSREERFELKNDVGVYGGFVGQETSREDRDPQAHTTTLSGDINAQGDSTDNSKQVVASVRDSRSTVLDGVTIRGAKGTSGLYIFASDPTLRNVTFSDNAGSPGAGASVIGEPLFDNCSFLNNNVSSGGGGAVRVGEGSSAVFLNSTFEANNASFGGAINNNGELNLFNVSFTSNGGPNSGGAISSNGGTISAVNVTFSNNFGDVGGAVFIAASEATFVNTTFADNKADSGFSGGISVAGEDSNVKIQNSIFWANEGFAQIRGQLDATIAVESTIVEGGYPGTNILDVDPQFASLPEGNLQLTEGSPAVDAGNTDFLPEDSYDLDGDGNTSEPIPLDLSGSPRLEGESVDLGVFEGTVDPVVSNVIFVDADALGAGDGSSWSDAYTSLQDALSAASTGVDIWVAEGTYKPDQGSGVTEGDRSESFNLQSGVGLYGGFAGDETSLEDRDIGGNPTVLSGDIGGQGEMSDNSTSVVYSFDNSTSAILNGFTVTKGNANVSSSDQFGGEIGGGLAAIQSSPTIKSVTFSRNFASQSGGGVGAVSVESEFRNVDFVSNEAGLGGGFYVSGGQTGGEFTTQFSLISATFQDNVATTGGGLANQSADLSVVNARFEGNSASSSGGAVDNGAELSITNGVFFDNSADIGGGLSNTESMVLTNVTIAFNVGSPGFSGGITTLVGETILRNSIVWGNEGFAQIRNPNEGTTTVEDAIVEGGYSGTNVVDANPKFVDGSDGDLHLERPPDASPAIDQGNNEHLPLDEVDLDEDGNIEERLPTDLRGDPRVQDVLPSSGAVVDLGAFESKGITRIENPPVANADSFEVVRDSILAVAAPGVLENDSDPNGDDLTASLVNNTSNGEITLDEDGSFKYDPSSGFTGQDDFTYAAIDASGASKTASVYIEVRPPPTPPENLSASVDGEEVLLTWTASTAEDLAQYRIYRSTAPIDSSAGPSALSVFDSTAAGETSYRDTSAASGQRYRYRVTAVDTASFESGFSREAVAAPEDLTPPAVPEGLVAELEGRQVALSWSAVAPEDLAGYRLYRSTGRRPDTSGAGLTEELISETTFTDTTATENRTYRYGVTAVDTAGNESVLSAEASVFRYPSQIQAEVSRSFGEAAGPGDYRLVALPGEGSRPIADVISGEAGAEWQAYRDDGSEEDFFQKYDGSSDFAFEPGNGFWVTATSDLAFEDSVSTVPLEGDSAATIPLRQGWNVISNPTGKAVQWTRVRQANPGSLQPLFGFEGTFSRADSLRPATSGRAYYLFNGSADRTELRVPYPGSPPSSGGQTDSKAGSRPLATGAGQSEASRSKARLISLSASLAGAGSPTSTVRVGVRAEEATRSVVAPPSRFEAVSLRIEAGEVKAGEAKAGETKTGEAEAGEKNRQDGRSGLLMAQLREGDGGGETFRLRLKGQAGAPVQLEASGVGEAESAALIRPSVGKTYRLRDGKTVRIEGAERPVSLKLAVGTESYVEGKREEAMPEKVRLTSYPNPVRRQGTLEYTLPEAGEVTLKVYDVLGRRVATLAEGRKQAGRHEVSLRVGDLPSGAYFGRLEAGGETRTQKITVVR